VSGNSPLCLLLLGGVLEEQPFARRAQDLLRAPGVAAVEPGRRPPGMLVGGVARRLVRRLPGTPRVLVLPDGVQAPLALALARSAPEAELWCASTVTGPARAAAALVFDAGDRVGEAPCDANAPLWDRLEALGIAAR